MATTDSLGRFRLRLAPRRPRGGRALVLHLAGYRSATVPVPATTRATTTLRLTLAAESGPAEVAVTGYAPSQRSYMTGGAISTITVRYRQPWPWRPRLFYVWSKYWLTRPFRRSH